MTAIRLRSRLRKLSTMVAHCSTVISPFHNRQNHRQLLKKASRRLQPQKPSAAAIFRPRSWFGPESAPTGRRRWSSSKECQNQCRQLSAMSPSRRSTKAQMNLRFNKTGRRRVRPTRQSPFGARMFGRPTRWTTRCGPSWKKKSRLLDTLQWGN